jgi:hypothetical protein
MVVALAAVGTPLAALAQELPQDRAQDRTRERARATQDLLAFLNDPGTLRIIGGGRIPQGSVVQGPVAVLGGSLALGGRVEGPLVVVNGDLRILPGARVEGDVTVVGGGVQGGQEADWLGGRLELQPTPLRYRIRGDRVEAEPAPTELPPFLVLELGGGAELRPVLRADGAYNRVEGLPVLVGGALSTRSRNPLEVEATATWRSASGLELERENLGYRFRALHGVGGRGEARIGVQAHRQVRPIEDRGMTDAESAFSTFLLRRDLRDHVTREGWAVFLEGRPLDLPLRPLLEYREEVHGFARIRDPWTLGAGERAWRPQPRVAEGSVRSLALGLEVDTRDDPADPAFGWWLQAELSRQVGGSATVASEVSTLALDPAELATRGHLDLRRYNRLGPTSRAHARILVSGSLNETPLLPQHQRTLGGEGSLPGHPRFAVDCGARRSAVPAPGVDPEAQDPPPSGTDPGALLAWPAYGCDGVALVQLQYEGRLPLAWRPGGEGNWELGSLLDLRPAWTAFVGGGWGWTHADAATGDLRENSPFRADAGVGVFLGPLGVYWATPLNRRERGVNFFVRLSHRF